MEKLVGVGASPGIAIGVAHVLASRVEIHERRIAAEQVDAELRRFENALMETDAQLARIQAQIAERGPIKLPSSPASRMPRISLGSRRTSTCASAVVGITFILTPARRIVGDIVVRSIASSSGARARI